MVEGREWETAEYSALHVTSSPHPSPKRLGDLSGRWGGTRVRARGNGGLMRNSIVWTRQGHHTHELTIT